MNPRSAQLLTAGLGVVLVLVVGATIFFLLSRPANQVGPTPTPSPSAVAIGSPTFTPSGLLTPTPSASISPLPTTPGATPTLSPALSPSPSASASVAPSTSPSASPTVSPSPTIVPSPTASPLPTPSPTPTLAPTPTPSINPTAPQREFKVLDVGIDSRSLGERRVERVVSFRVDGQSFVSARVSGATASGFRLCLYGEDDPIENDPQFCSTSRNAVVTRPKLDSGTATYFATLIGTETNVSPVVDLTLTYNSNSGSATLDNFRYAGTNNPGYNGFTMEIPTAGGASLNFFARFDPGGSYRYHLVIQQVGGGDVRNDQPADPVAQVSTSDPVGAATYRLTFENPEATVGEFVSSVISWP